MELWEGPRLVEEGYKCTTNNLQAAARILCIYAAAYQRAKEDRPACTSRHTHICIYVITLLFVSSYQNLYYIHRQTLPHGMGTLFLLSLNLFSYSFIIKNI